VLEKRFGLGQGFATYDDRLTGGQRPSRRGVAYRPAAFVVDAAYGWLNGVDQQERFFAWVHFFDPHFPYAAPEIYRERYADRPYDAEVAYLDAEIGRLLGHPRIGDDVMIAVVGDHGESLGDHGERTHGFLVYGSTMSIPWIVRIPGGPAGLRIEEPVSQVDVLPTLAELLGREVPVDLPGRSLTPLIDEGGAPDESALYFESHMGYATHGWAKLQGLVRGPWKLIQSPQPELYHLEQDPDEESNLAASEPQILRGMVRELASFLSERQAEITVDDETADRLRALGYLAATSPRQRDGDRPNPKDMVGLNYEILDFFETEPPPLPEEVVAFLEGVLERDPQNLQVRFDLLENLAHLGRYGEAEVVFERTLELNDRPGPILVLYAQIQRRQGHIERALELTSRAVEIDPLLESAWIERISLLSETGAIDEARRTLETALASAPDTPRLNVMRARLVEMADGEFISAEAGLRRALERDPFIVEGYQILAELLEGQDRDAEAVDTLEEGLGHYPEDVDLQTRLGMLLARIGRPQEAQIHLGRAIDLSSSPLPQVEAALDVLVAQRQRAAGKEDTGEGSPGRPRDTASSLQQAAAYLGAGRLDEAEAELERLLARSPDNIDALFAMASIQMQRHDPKGTETYLRRVLEIEPRRADVWSDLGLILEEQGRAQEAERCYQQALEIEAGLPQALMNLGILALRQERW
jgi:choline-sulfatase